jgi:hypothetical protein
MRKVSLLILVVFMLANVFASKIGIGLSTTWNDNEVYIPGFSTIWNGAAIYIPINVNPQFRIEPFVMVATDASEETDPDNPEWSYNNEILNYRIGLGLFIKSKISENSKYNFYYGSKFSYVNSTSEGVYKNGDGMGWWYEEISTVELSGFSITPTLGFEYYFIDNCSFGGEIGWNYTQLSGEDKYEALDSSGGSWEDIQELEDTTTGIINRINIRFYF